VACAAAAAAAAITARARPAACCVLLAGGAGCCKLLCVVHGNQTRHVRSGSQQGGVPTISEGDSGDMCVCLAPKQPLEGAACAAVARPECTCWHVLAHCSMALAVCFAQCAGCAAAAPSHARPQPLTHASAQLRAGAPMGRWAGCQVAQQLHPTAPQPWHVVGAPARQQAARRMPPTELSSPESRRVRLDSCVARACCVPGAQMLVWCPERAFGAPGVDLGQRREPGVADPR
jgi:hypothetical protein